MDPAATVEAAPPAGSAIPDDDDGLPEAATDQQEPHEDGLDTAYRFLKRQLAEQPLTVLAMALGAGLALGALFSDRR